MRNADGSGARMALLSTRVREKELRMAKLTHYVELTTELNFSAIFAIRLMLP